VVQTETVLHTATLPDIFCPSLFGRLPRMVPLCFPSHLLFCSPIPGGRRFCSPASYSPHGDSHLQHTIFTLHGWRQGPCGAVLHYPKRPAIILPGLPLLCLWTLNLHERWFCHLPGPLWDLVPPVVSDFVLLYRFLHYDSPSFTFLERYVLFCWVPYAWQNAVDLPTHTW